MSRTITATVSAAGATKTFSLAAPTSVPVFYSPSNPDPVSAIDQMKAHPYLTGLATYGQGDVQYAGAWANQVAAFPSGQDVLTMAIGVTPAGATSFLNSFPAAWKARTRIISKGQEMEDNLTTAAARSQFQSEIPALAKAVTDLGALCVIECQEWYLNPANPDADPTIAASLYHPSLSAVVWSVLNHNQKQTSIAQVDRVKAWMAKYAPGKPWGIASGGAAIPYANPTAAQKQAALQINQTLWPYARSQGASWLGLWGSYSATKQPPVDYRLSSNELLTNAVMTKAMSG